MESPGWAKLVQVLGIVVIISGVFSAISAFMMRGRWNLARKIFLWVILVNGVAHTALTLYILSWLGEPIWNTPAESLMILWIPLMVAIMANVVYRLPSMRAFFGHSRQRTADADVLDDVVIESETDGRG
jgi:uncharacterized membrane protein HdeD (DUF308 family)